MDQQNTLVNVLEMGIQQRLADLEFSCTVFVKSLEDLFKRSNISSSEVLFDGFYYDVRYSSENSVRIDRSKTKLHNFIVFDLEATCWDDETNKGQNETIEIGAVKLRRNDQGIVCGIDTFNLFVKPKFNPQLSDFCKRLTTIQQTDVDGALDFPEAYSKFMDWCSDSGSNGFTMLSWGLYDKSQLKRDCSKWEMPEPTWDHKSLRHQYSDISSAPRCSIKDALRSLGIDFQGTYHRGIDDAKNISKIFVAMYDMWVL